MREDKVRVLHLLGSNFVGGPEKQILNHALDLLGTEYEVWIGSFRDEPRRAEILQHAEADGLPICDLSSSGRFVPRTAWELAVFLRRERIQLLCTHGYKANIIGVFAKRLAGLPQVAFCRGWTAETLRVRAYEFLDRQLLPYADRVVCVSEAQAHQLGRSRRLRGRLCVVHNAVLQRGDITRERDRETAKTKLGYAKDIRLVGAVGRLSREKGHCFLVAAAAELAQHFKNLRIVILGAGRERPTLESQVERLGLQHVIQLPGFRTDINLWMQAFDVLVSCSLTEGIPNAVLEALAVGTPVVATAVGGVPELIHDWETGLLVPPADSSALAVALKTVLQDSRLAVTLGQNGSAWVHTHFSARRQRGTLLAIYRDCIGPFISSSKAPDGRATKKSTTTPPFLIEGTESAMGMPQPLSFISVIVPVRNEERHLPAILEELLAQQYPKDRYEILVVDGNSTDGTPAVLERYARTSPVRLLQLDNPRQLSSAGRNAGLQNSHGDLIVFVDGHCRIPSPTLLLDTARLFYATGADCLCRPQPLTMSGNTWFQDVVAHVRATALGHGLDSTIYASHLEGFIDPTSSGASYRRSVFDRVGAYDERFDACEDVEFNYRVLRAGLRSYTSSRLTVQYWPRETLCGLCKQMVRYGRGRVRFTRKHPDAPTFSQMVPAALLVWLLIGGIFSTASQRVGQIVLATLVAYLSLVLFFAVRLGVRYGWRHLVTAPVIYFAVHLGLGAGFLAEAAKPLVDRFAFWRKGSEPAQPTGVPFVVRADKAQPHHSNLAKPELPAQRLD